MALQPPRKLYGCQKKSACVDLRVKYRMKNTFEKCKRRLKRKIRTFIGRDINQKIQTNCRTERYGSDYGGWIICPNYINSQSVIYSFGIGEDASFDTALIDRFDVDVFAFDPTPKSIVWVKEQCFSDRFKMHPYGLAAVDDEVLFYPPDNAEHVSHTIVGDISKKTQAITVPVFRLSTIMKVLGHQQIDILKMDIEGAEYGVIPDILASNIIIRQILVEFHHRSRRMNVEDTKEAISRLNLAGYRIFAISDNGDEYSFISDTLSAVSDPGNGGVSSTSALPCMDDAPPGHP